MNKLWSLNMTYEQKKAMLDAALAANTITQTEYDAELVILKSARDAAAEAIAEATRRKKERKEIREATGATKAQLVLNRSINLRLVAAELDADGDRSEARKLRKLASASIYAVKGNDQFYSY